MPSNPTPQSATRLTAALPAWPETLPSPTGGKYTVGVFPGEGVGPEVIGVATKVLKTVASRWDLDFEFRQGGLIGKAAEREHGMALTPEVVAFCESIFGDGGTILCGAGGGRFVYDLRARFDLFCKFTPVRPLTALHDAGPLRPSAVAGADLVVVRENASGLYFGEGRRTAEGATHTFAYRYEEVRRIIEVAIGLARQRRGRLTLVVKPSAIREISDLWREIFDELTAGQSLDVGCLEVDNANYQIIANGRAFDVVVTSNLFGDVLSDGAALLLGSRGMSYSGNFGAPGVAVYQTGHGAAHDLAGRDVANPIGQIHSAAFLLRESFGLEEPAAAIEAAVHQVLADGWRTVDIAAQDSRVIGTQEMGRRIISALESTPSPVSIPA